MFRFVCNIVRHQPFSCKSNKTLNNILCKYYSVCVTKSDEKKCVEIKNGNRCDVYHYMWLRDHCRCDKCYNSVTAQRKLNVNEIPDNINIETADVENGVLKVVWKGGHVSAYPVSWLESCVFENYRKRLRRAYKLWNKEDVIKAEIAAVDHEQLLMSDECLTELMKSLIHYGVGFVKNAPDTLQGTELAVRRIGPVQTTLFGGMWEFSDVLNHNDTAYTREALEGHTDNTYFTESAGLQVLHCTYHDGEGGETTLTDGFKAVSILKARHPDVFDRLTEAVVGAEYIEEGKHHICVAPILRLNPITKEIEQIRFNLNDRAPLMLPHDQISRFYHDLRILTGIIRDKDLEWKFKLNPGTFVVFDNFRILHGRTAYTGSRKMCGCYISRTDFMSRARVLNLI